MTIPSLDLKAQYDTIKAEIDEAIRTVIDRTDFILGKTVTALEERIAAYCGVKYAVGLNSGTDALFASLKALGITKGDEVITTPFSFIATAEVITLLEARPVFVDIDPKTFNLDPTKIAERITKKTKAIIPVHLYGQPADMQPILDIAAKHNLPIIEDAAQAFGAEYNQKKTGSLGTVGCFSFFPSKNLGAYGDGGMIVTNQKNIADYVCMWRAHGSSKKYYSEFVGDNSRLDTIQAAILSVKLKYLDRWNEARAQKAKTYDQLLNRVGVVTPYADPRVKHIYHQYTVKTPDRDKLAAWLTTNDIETKVYYPLPLHQQPALSYLGYQAGDFPVTEQACQEVLSLPIYPELTADQQQKVIKTITDFYRQP